jgi:hypothetical protein
MNISGFYGVTLVGMKSGRPFDKVFARHLAVSTGMTAFTTEKCGQDAYCILASQEKLLLQFEGYSSENLREFSGYVYQIAPEKVLLQRGYALHWLTVDHYWGGMFNPAIPLDTHQMIRLN